MWIGSGGVCAAARELCDTGATRQTAVHQSLPKMTRGRGRATNAHAAASAAPTVNAGQFKNAYEENDAAAAATRRHRSPSFSALNLPPNASSLPRLFNRLNYGRSVSRETPRAVDITGEHFSGAAFTSSLISSRYLEATLRLPKHWRT